MVPTFPSANASRPGLPRPWLSGASGKRTGAGAETKKLSQNPLLNSCKALIEKKLDRESGVLRLGRSPTRTCDHSAEGSEIVS